LIFLKDHNTQPLLKVTLKKKYQPEGWYFHVWWAHQDLNLGPKDSGLCSFHYSLDYAFIILIAQLRWVPSSLYTFNSTFTLKLGSALACAAFGCI
jgi:hypothetical protein